MLHKVNYTYLYSTLIQSPRLDIHKIVHPNVWQWAVWVFQKPPDCQNREGLAAYSWAWTLYTVELPPIVWPYIKKDILHAWKLERIIDQLLPSKTQKFYLLLHACKANQPTPSSSKLRCSLSAPTLSPLSETTSALISPTSSGSFPSQLLQSC